MDDCRFDHLTRILASSAPRRVFTGALASGALATLLGASAEDAAARKKRRKKKKKKASNCTPSCFNKVCGQDNGCGDKCTVQLGCDSDEACIDGTCVATVCDPPCTGNKLCLPNGSCACPPGLPKECPIDLGNPGYCHECCQDEFGGGDGDADCEGNTNGVFCFAETGDPVGRCRCRSAQTTCPNGTCGGCCGLEECFADVFGTGPVDTGQDCVVVSPQTGEFGCTRRSGTTLCPNFIYCRGPRNPLACGSDCDNCTRRDGGFVCDGSPERCCLPTGAVCALNTEECCGGPTACVFSAQAGTKLCA